LHAAGISSTVIGGTHHPMPLDPRALHLYSDGSCYGNPGGRGGAAAYVEFPDHLNCETKEIVRFGCAETSNQRMELIACIEALKWVRANKPWASVTRIQVVTDSRYLVENVSRARTWKKNKWRNQDGEPRENSNLWNQLLGIIAKIDMRVDFEWQAGKTSPILKAVDKAAKAAAKQGGMDSDVGFRSGKVSRSKVKGSATRFPAQAQTAVIRPYRKNAPIKAENKIRFDLLDEAKREYSASYYAYASDLLTIELSRQGLYRVRFNDTPRYPKIVEIVETLLLGRASPRADR
jgi:ribonuclease HI